MKGAFAPRPGGAVSTVSVVMRVTAREIPDVANVTAKLYAVITSVKSPIPSAPTIFVTYTLYPTETVRIKSAAADISIAFLKNRFAPDMTPPTPQNKKSRFILCGGEFRYDSGQRRT
ncbi:MAG: hypothetical protein LUI15_02585 [Firmicutes bacterium]|nr:hypothetical protein [Bacillota bacterium]